LKISGLDLPKPGRRTIYFEWLLDLVSDATDAERRWGVPEVWGGLGVDGETVGFDDWLGRSATKAMRLAKNAIKLLQFSISLALPHLVISLEVSY
jgi:hypothetical protein